jgi:hypothetical protein
MSVESDSAPTNPPSLANTATLPSTPNFTGDQEDYSDADDELSVKEEPRSPNLCG